MPVLKRLLTAMLVVFPLLCYGQYDEATWSLQPKAGINVSTITNNSSWDPKVGAAAGVEFEYQATERISLSYSGMFSMQGAKIDLGIIKPKYKLYYLIFPLLINVHLKKGFALKTGIQPSLKIYEKPESKPEEINKNDFTIPVGLSYELNHVIIDGRFFIGFKRINKNYAGNNCVFQLTLGYKIEL